MARGKKSQGRRRGRGAANPPQTSQEEAAKLAEVPENHWILIMNMWPWAQLSWQPDGGLRNRQDSKNWVMAHIRMSSPTFRWKNWRQRAKSSRPSDGKDVNSIAFMDWPTTRIRASVAVQFLGRRRWLP